VGHYKSNVRDQVFNLFEVFGLDKTLGEGSFSDLDADTATVQPLAQVPEHAQARFRALLQDRKVLAVLESRDPRP